PVHAGRSRRVTTCRGNPTAIAWRTEIACTATSLACRCPFNGSPGRHLGLDLKDRIAQSVPFLRRGLPAAAKTQHAAALVRSKTHRAQHVRRFFFSARASRASRNREAGLVELDDPTLLAIVFGHTSGNRVP